MVIQKMLDTGMRSMPQEERWMWARWAILRAKKKLEGARLWLLEPGSCLMEGGGRWFRVMQMV